MEAGLAAYGMHLGTAFQLIDDVLDYSGDAAAIGKSLGDDLAEGKPTLPLIRALRTGNGEQAGVVRHAILEGGREDFAGVLEVIRASGALDYARAAALRESSAAARRARAAARLGIQGIFARIGVLFGGPQQLILQLLHRRIGV